MNVTEAWNEQTQRRPPRFQVWRNRKLLLSTDDEQAAIDMAALHDATITEGWQVALRFTPSGRARGPLRQAARIARAVRRLAEARNGTCLSDLHITRAEALQLAERAGVHIERGADRRRWRVFKGAPPTTTTHNP